MLVFITHPKYFDKSKLLRKKVDLCYIFNSKTLYKELSKKYKCVNLDRSYKIVDENFFPSETYDERLIYHRMFGFKQTILGYFYKKKYALMGRRQRMVQSYKRDVLYRMTQSHTKELFRKDKNEGITLLNQKIYGVVEEIIKNEVSQSYYNENKKHFELFFNITDSFYRSYIYALLDVKRGAEITADILKYNYVLNAIMYYRPEKGDVYRGAFHYDYLKVLSRLFIENIHNNRGIKEFTENNIALWGES